MQNRKRDTDLENSLLDSVGEGEVGMFQENSIKQTALEERINNTKATAGLSSAHLNMSVLPTCPAIESVPISHY